MPARRLSRRLFTRSIAAGMGGVAVGGGALGAGVPDRAGMNGARVIAESVRKVPVVSDAEVVVCGGGPAGVAAALAAARSGAKTQLLEVHGCLGGIWTAGALSWIIDARNKTGVMAELCEQLIQQRAGKWCGASVVYDPEAMKQILEHELVDAGVRIRLFTRVVGAVLEDRRLSAVVTESKSGREAWTGDAFVDCTGDGDLAALAGCGFDLGHPKTGSLQPMSLMAVFAGVEQDSIADFINNAPSPTRKGTAKQNLLAEFRRAGVEPSYGGPTIFVIRDGLYALMANHQYDVSPLNADDVTRATLEARKENHSLVQALRRLGGPWQSIRIVYTAEQIGTREGRRIHGLYQVSADDLRKGTQFEDSICRVTFGIDVHSTNPHKTKAIERKPFTPNPTIFPCGRWSHATSTA